MFITFDNSISEMVKIMSGVDTPTLSAFENG